MRYVFLCITHCSENVFVAGLLELRLVAHCKAFTAGLSKQEGNMRRIGLSIAAALAGTLAVAVCPARADLVKPWDDLIANPDPSWIDPHSVNMYAANVAESFPVMFGEARSDGGARGMNSIRFVDTSDAHHVSRAATGSVDVLATGGVPFSDVLVLVAIDSATLPDNFALTMNGYACDRQADFVYYDGTAYAAGRPSGYYSPVTNPAREPIAYNFQAGMVTVLAFTDVMLDPEHPVVLDYAFENLPARAVFSAYAFPTGGMEIYHTNRGLEDLSSSSRTVSTFEIAGLPGDVDGDGVVGAADYVTLKRNIGEGTGAGQSEGDFDNDGDVDSDDLGTLIGGFQAGSGETTTIPEPAAAAFLFFGAAWLRRRRRIIGGPSGLTRSSSCGTKRRGS